MQFLNKSGSINETNIENNKDALKIIYYAFFHSIMSSGLIFWVNSTHSDYIFKLQKKKNP